MSRLLRAGLAALVAAGTLVTVVAPASSADPRGHHDNGPSGVAAPEAAIADAGSGRILWSRELNTQRPIASITKVMTALVVLRSGGLDNVVTVPKAVVGYISEYGASGAGLHPGDRLTVRELLYAMLLPSGADAAYTLAQAYGPGLSAFVTKMNQTAAAVGMRHSNFSNFDGLPYPQNNADLSTAADLITLGRTAMRYWVFRAVVGAASYSLKSGGGHHGYAWTNTNPLIGHYPGAMGIKTGWTPFTGHCLLFEDSLGGVTLIGVNLDSPGKGMVVNGNDAVAMLNWAFAQSNA
jgi:D-alanyl-D-alanine carboxypeptidase (penicillin-binding protein 5/6)